MFRVLRIVFCVISCLLFASAILVGTFYGIWYGIGTALVSAISAGLMLLVKDGNPFKRKEEPPKPDFMNSDEENENIRNKKG